MSHQIKICFLSDTHIFYPNSRFKDGIPPELIKRLSDECDILVLGGDVFDFHYAFQYQANHFDGKKMVEKEGEEKRVINPKLRHILRGVVNEAIEQISAINAALAKNGSSSAVLVGNHDNVSRYVSKLSQILDPNFIYDPEYLMLGDLLVTHGDLPLRRQSLETRERLLHPKDMVAQRKKMWVESLLHEPIQRTWFYAWNHPSLLVPRMYDGIEETLNSKAWAAAKHIATGHTHVWPYAGIEHKGKFFYHTGATVGQRHCHPLVFTIESDAPYEIAALKKSLPMLYTGAKVTEIKRIEIYNEQSWQLRTTEADIIRVCR
jgi:UDP-2,3-diacylglucosamine pyrophosphatase LpxH